VDGVICASMKLVVVPVMLKDQVVDVDAGGVLVAGK